MPSSFVKFLLSEASTLYVETALKDMKESPDRYTNALHTMQTGLLIPHLNSLVVKYKKLFTLPYELDLENKEVLFLDPKSKNSVRHFADELIQIACRELLDNDGNLHPVIINTFKLGENHTVLRDQLLKGFAHYIFREMIGTKIFRDELKTWLRKDWAERETLSHLQNAVDSVIREQLTNSKKISQLIHQHVMKQQLFSTAPYDSDFIEMACCDPDFFKYGNFLEYLKATAMKILTAIKMHVRNVSVKFNQQFKSYPNYGDQMDRMIADLTLSLGTYQTINFPKLQTNITTMQQLTARAKKTTEQNDLFSFFKPADENIVNIKKYLNIIFNIANLIAESHPNSRYIL